MPRAAARATGRVPEGEAPHVLFAATHSKIADWDRQRPPAPGGPAQRTSSGGHRSPPAAHLVHPGRKEGRQYWPHLAEPIPGLAAGSVESRAPQVPLHTPLYAVAPARANRARERRGSLSSKKVRHPGRRKPALRGHLCTSQDGRSVSA
ncbi:hypothetical protein NDU88_011600 [Pleurodeles waltl]|uniref:Uncharacterized protein n=1 Tax=Pleurodeles waltl TaxID=8319 RepID=A0AAV7S7C0_PLEWA|nr:hypothetical protein NDU88_011600 [Pleurodeles waltl]